MSTSRDSAARAHSHSRTGNTAHPAVLDSASSPRSGLSCIEVSISRGYKSRIASSDCTDAQLSTMVQHHSAAGARSCTARRFRAVAASQPSGSSHQRVREELAVAAVGSVRFCGPVLLLAIWREIRLRELVEAIHEEPAPSLFRPDHDTHHRQNHNREAAQGDDNAAGHPKDLAALEAGTTPVPEPSGSARRPDVSVAQPSSAPRSRAGHPAPTPHQASCTSAPRAVRVDLDRRRQMRSAVGR